MRGSFFLFAPRQGPARRPPRRPHRGPRRARGRAADPRPAAGGGLANRSTAFDWERFFWDLATEHDVPAETLSDLLLNLDPVTLDPDDNGGGVNDPCGSDTTADDVTVRLPAAAASTWCFSCSTPGPLTSAVAAEVEYGQDH